MNIYLKRFSLLITLVCALSACTAVKHIQKVKEISTERATKECTEPTELYFVPPTSYGIEVRLMRHENCMGIPDMVMAIWFGEKTEINELVAKLLVLMYIQSKNADSQVQYGRVFLKTERLELDSPSPAYITFFELVVIDPKDYE